MTDTPESVRGTRSCTCHPNDRPPNPCAKQYAMRECEATTDTIPSCSYYCERPECMKAQRDALRDKCMSLEAERDGVRRMGRTPDQLERLRGLAECRAASRYAHLLAHVRRAILADVIAEYEWRSHAYDRIEVALGDGLQALALERELDDVGLGPDGVLDLQDLKAMTVARANP